MSARVFPCFDAPTNTVTYVVAEPAGLAAAIIDSVLDFDPASGRTARVAADKVLAVVAQHRLRVEWILETHVHADHLSAAPYLKEKLGAKVGIGERITEVQAAFKRIFNAEPEFATDGSQFDRLFEDGATVRLGALEGRVLHTPGHTPACVTYVFGNAAFVGDSIFMPDFGSARCDFPAGDARTLYRSIRRILDLPPATRIFVCHDYGTEERPVAWETTVAAERQGNIHVKEGATEDAFVAMRNQRDRTLAMPRLLLPSVQINMRAGHPPPADANGMRYLKLPLDAF
ncbi:MAG: MBL fold metallo-hydrolase [Alphaproteobacteria bacterium]|nr:MBL fold metallo-hydrolase [Alphaproteobacteria bacterium]